MQTFGEKTVYKKVFSYLSLVFGMCLLWLIENTIETLSPYQIGNNLVLATISYETFQR